MSKNTEGRKRPNLRYRVDGVDRDRFQVTIDKALRKRAMAYIKHRNSKARGKGTNFSALLEAGLKHALRNFKEQ